MELDLIVRDWSSGFQTGKENNIEVIGCRFYLSKEKELNVANHVVDSLKHIKWLL